MNSTQNAHPYKLNSLDRGASTRLDMLEDCICNIKPPENWKASTTIIDELSIEPIHKDSSDVEIKCENKYKVPMSIAVSCLSLPSMQTVAGSPCRMHNINKGESTCDKLYIISCLSV